VIYVLAANLEDARQWAGFRALSTRDWTYAGDHTFAGRRLSETDSIVRTARAAAHPAHEHIEQELAISTTFAGLTETKDGLLVRRHV
jgi:hypothetical protein